MSEDILPRAWVNTRIADIGVVSGGVTKNASKKTTRSLPYLRVANVYANELRLDDVTEIGVNDADLGRVLLHAGDLLLVEGNGSLDQIGRVAVWRGAIDPCVHQNHLIKVRFEDDVHEDFVKYWLLSPVGRRHVTLAASSTSGLHTLSISKVEILPVRLAPPAGQSRIVDALDSYLSRLDAAVMSLERVQAKLKAYRASVLKAAVEGRLVPTEAELARQEKRAYEPADALLARILEERRRRWEEAELAKLEAAGKKPKDDSWKEKYEEPSPPGMSNLPDLPEGWCWASLEQLSHLLRNGQSRPPREESGVRTLRISAVRPLALDFEDVRFLPGSPLDYPDDLVELGDLLFTRYNGTPSLVGVCARVRVLTEPTVHPDKLIKVRLWPDLHGPYVEVAANAGESRRLIERRTRTTAGQAGISGSDLKQMPIPVPPLTEQVRIADEVERLVSVADETRAAVLNDARRCARLRQCVLKWAFEGKLVDQDPSDEPAEKLLARIRAGRAAAFPAKNTWGRTARAAT